MDCGTSLSWIDLETYIETKGTNIKIMYVSFYFCVYDHSFIGKSALADPNITITYPNNHILSFVEC